MKTNRDGVESKKIAVALKLIPSIVVVRDITTLLHSAMESSMLKLSLKGVPGWM